MRVDEQVRPLTERNGGRELRAERVVRDGQHLDRRVVETRNDFAERPLLGAPVRVPEMNGGRGSRGE